MTARKQLPDAERARSGEIPLAEAARYLGLTSQGLGQWAMRPGAPARRDGNRVWVQWPSFARWREQEMVRTEVERQAPAVSLDEARTRKALAEAELAELEVERARGSWVSVADSGAALGRALDLVCARLRTLGASVASHGAAVEAAVEREAERLIEELHRMDDDVLDEPAEQERAA